MLLADRFLDCAAGQKNDFAAVRALYQVIGYALGFAVCKALLYKSREHVRRRMNPTCRLFGERIPHGFWKFLVHPSFPLFSL